MIRFCVSVIQKASINAHMYAEKGKKEKKDITDVRSRA